MADFDDTETPPAPSYHMDRPSGRTPDERQAHYEHWLVKHKPYDDVVVEAGDMPWWTSEDERRAKFMRRYQRPSPPAYLPTRTLKEINTA